MQRSKSIGSHGAKASYEIHNNCIHCRAHVPLRQLNADRLCKACFNRHYPTGTWTSGVGHRGNTV